jgi:4-oxalocrotonate tautomerase
MPIVTIQVTREGTAPGADRTTPGQKEALYAGISDLLRDVLGKDPGDTFIIFQEVELDDWARGGLSVPMHRRRAGKQAPDTPPPPV